MRLINVPYEEFLKRTEKKRVIQFGASSAWHYYLQIFPDIPEEVLDRTMFIVDNDPSKHGKDFEIHKRAFRIEAVEKIKEESDYVVLITVSIAYQKEICEQLMAMNLPEHIECYSLPLMTYNFHEPDNSCVDLYFDNHRKAVNKPVIHSFWFSGEEKPELYKRCVDSWRRFCPGFEIREWTAENYDITKNRYMREAFENRKWATASDYARLDVLYQYGGIYMDMDVELLAPIDHLLKADSFFCRQEDGFLELGSGFGALPGDSLIREMLATYENRRLILEDGRIDKTPQPEWLNGILRKHGIEKCHDSQIIDGRLILSNDYLSSVTGEESIHRARLGIHWHNGGWLEEKERKLIKDSLAAKKQLITEYFTDQA